MERKIKENQKIREQKLNSPWGTTFKSAGLKDWQVIKCVDLLSRLSGGILEDLEAACMNLELSEADTLYLIGSYLAEVGDRAPLQEELTLLAQTLKQRDAGALEEDNILFQMKWDKRLKEEILPKVLGENIKSLKKDQTQIPSQNVLPFKSPKGRKKETSAQTKPQQSQCRPAA